MASERLRVLSVFERTLPASVAVGGGLPTASINDVLCRRLEQELGQAISTLDPDTEVEATLIDGAAHELLSRTSAGLDLLVVGSREPGAKGPRTRARRPQVDVLNAPAQRQDAGTPAVGHQHRDRPAQTPSGAHRPVPASWRCLNRLSTIGLRTGQGSARKHLYVWRVVDGGTP
jgi:hypothetical protein